MLVNKPADPVPEPKPDSATDPAPAAPPGTDAARWAAGLDRGAAVLVVTLGLLVASFAARNSDFWLNLAAGRLVTHFEYPFGQDPFSYADADRPWANHAWLFGVFLYALYSLNTTGALVVAVKAGLVAGLAGLLLAVRRPGQTLWPGAVAVGLALVAMAPRLALQPVVASIVLLGVTVYLLLDEGDDAAWRRRPFILAAVFALWVNLDHWFLLGPFAVALVLLGDLVHRLLEPETALPPARLKRLGLALGLGLLALLVNPYLHRALTPPPELFTGLLPPAVRDDSSLAPLFYSPLSGDYFDSALYGNSRPGYAGVALFGLSLASFLVNLGGLRWRGVLLWTGFALLALFHARAIPFFAVVAAPLTALNFGAVAGRLRQRFADTPADAPPSPQAAALRVVGLLGRVLTVLALAGALAAAWPGWLHPKPPLDYLARRVTWAVTPDPSLARAAGQLRAWREQGRLPAAARQFNLDPDLLHYCAWFAPGELGYADYRLDRPALADLLAVRLALKDATTARPDPRRLPEALERLRRAGATFLTAYRLTPDDSTRALLPLWFDPQWVLWYLDGRTTMLGWADPRRAAAAAPADGLRLDLVREAFGPPAALVPAPPPPEERLDDLRNREQWYADFLSGSPAPPLEAAEAALVLRYSQIAASRAMQAAGAAGPAGKNAAPVVDQSVVPAGALLAVRAARRAIAAQPSSPDAYFALAQAEATRLQPTPLPVQTFLPPADPRLVIRLVALRQGLARVRPGGEAAPSGTWFDLFTLHKELGHEDLALEALERSLAAGEVPPAARAAPPEQVTRELGQLLKAQQDGVRQLTDEWEVLAGRAPNDPIARARLALAAGAALAERNRRRERPAEAGPLPMRGGLYRLAFEELERADRSRYTPQQEVLATGMQLGLLLTALGRVEEVHGQTVLQTAPEYAGLRFLAALADGDYEEAGGLLDRGTTGPVGTVNLPAGAVVVLLQAQVVRAMGQVAALMAVVAPPAGKGVAETVLRPWEQALSVVVGTAESPATDRLRLLTQRGMIALRAGDTDGAFQAFQRALEVQGPLGNPLGQEAQEARGFAATYAGLLGRYRPASR